MMNKPPNIGLSSSSTLFVKNKKNRNQITQ